MVVLGFTVVLGLAVITTGALVVLIGMVLDRVDAAVFVSIYLFVVDALRLGGGEEEYGNKSIIIGSEDGPGGGSLSIELRLTSEFAA